ncbi:MAG: DUF192 domain-containing protein [Candidatus Omnitrophica bacterium]|nr:DUF192 domain-containing protein [Candidatus Omnitrophota bacterium]
MKLKLLLIVLIVLLSGFFFWFTAALRFRLKERKINVSGRQLTVWVADTQEARLKGLQNIIWLPKNRGMLFAFNTPDQYCFWNKNTLIPLKLIFMRGEKVTEELELRPIWKGQQTICPNYDADCVIEVSR